MVQMYKGIDVSEHNDAIDWQKVAASGISFAVIRAGLGCKSDARFEENIRGAAKAGLAASVTEGGVLVAIIAAIKPTARRI